MWKVLGAKKVIKIPNLVAKILKRTCKHCIHYEMTEGGYFCTLPHKIVYQEPDSHCNEFKRVKKENK